MKKVIIEWKNGVVDIIKDIRLVSYSDKVLNLKNSFRTVSVKQFKLSDIKRVIVEEME